MHYRPQVLEDALLVTGAHGQEAAREASKAGYLKTQLSYVLSTVHVGNTAACSLAVFHVLKTVVCLFFVYDSSRWLGQLAVVIPYCL